MSAALFAAIPLALGLIVLALCFTGCAQIVGIQQYQSATDYENTVLGTNGLIAYWGLGDGSGTTALDFGPSHSFNGTYTTLPQAVGYDAGDQSAAATGTVNPGESGIVPGDEPSTCPFFDGGFVSVPWNPVIETASQSFTLEAWVRPHWPASDVQNFPAVRAVVASANLSTNSGFAILATADNFWEANVGTGSTILVARPDPTSNQTIIADTTYYLVMTYDGTTLSLWVNPADTNPGPYAQNTMGNGFVQVTATTPLFIGTGRPDQPTPLFPFTGWIQDVAIYNVALDNDTIAMHYMHGNGIKIT